MAAKHRTRKSGERTHLEADIMAAWDQGIEFVVTYQRLSSNNKLQVLDMLAEMHRKQNGRHQGAVRLAALEEAVTRKRRQRANAKRARPDGLQSLILDVMGPNPAMRRAELIQRLRKYEHGDVIDDILDNEEKIYWRDKNNPAGETSFTALTHRMSRARKTLKSR